MDIRARLGKRIRELRERIGKSQADLALSADLSRDFVGTVERGEQSPTADSLAKLARALGVDTHDLFLFDASSSNPPSDPDSAFARRVALAAKGAPPHLLEAYARMTEVFFEGLGGLGGLGRRRARRRGGRRRQRR